MPPYYQRNADGAVLNPPIIREYEDRMAAATAAADYAQILSVQRAYNEARDTLVKDTEGGESDGLGWSDEALLKDVTVQDITPRLPEGSAPLMPAGLTDAQVEEQRALRAEVAEMRKGMSELMAALTQRGESVPDSAGFDPPRMDAPNPSPDAPVRPLGGTDVSAGPQDKPTVVPQAGTPLGGTGVTAGPADPSNPVPGVQQAPAENNAPADNGGDS